MVGHLSRDQQHDPTLTYYCIFHHYGHTKFGTNLAGTRGKTMRHNTDTVVMDYVAVPRNFSKQHKFVTLVEDVMFIIGTSF